MPRGKIYFHHDGTTTYQVDGKKVTKKKWDQVFPSKELGATYLAPIQDWASENNGRGREISQLRETPNSPRVYASSPSHAMELAKRRGYEQPERS